MLVQGVFEEHLILINYRSKLISLLVEFPRGWCRGARLPRRILDTVYMAVNFIRRATRAGGKLSNQLRYPPYLLQNVMTITIITQCLHIIIIYLYSFLLFFLFFLFSSFFSLFPPSSPTSIYYSLPKNSILTSSIIPLYSYNNV